MRLGLHASGCRQASGRTWGQLVLASKQGGDPADTQGQAASYLMPSVWPVWHFEIFLISCQNLEEILYKSPGFQILLKNGKIQEPWAIPSGPREAGLSSTNPLYGAHAVQVPWATIHLACFHGCLYPGSGNSNAIFPQALSD